jgi:hypothetical protein
MPAGEALFLECASAAVVIPNLVGKDASPGSEKSGQNASCGVMQRQP